MCLEPLEGLPGWLVGAIGFVRPWLHVRTRWPFLHDWHAYVLPSKNCFGMTSAFFSVFLTLFSSMAELVVMVVMWQTKPAQVRIEVGWADGREVGVVPRYEGRGSLEMSVEVGAWYVVSPA